MKSGRIRAGMGGWTYEPWRETFYPSGVAKSAELHYASRQVTAIEINGTFYRLQTPAVFAKWRDETPDDFVFAVKAPRYIVHRRQLAEAKDHIPRFIASGLSQLGPKLGPILWQLAPEKQFDADEIDAFLGLLPSQADGVPLRHALHARHESFRNPEFIALTRRHGATTVFEDDDEYPAIADVTGSFVYARLRRTLASEATGYPAPALEAWARRAQTWASGGEPDDLPRVHETHSKQTPRDVFMFFIAGAKERAPAAARALLSILGEAPAPAAVAAPAPGRRKR
jgi:uncharacterized protein YecE (DUF72 family)